MARNYLHLHYFSGEVNKENARLTKGNETYVEHIIKSSKDFRRRREESFSGQIFR